jgi:hypothetical protein
VKVFALACPRCETYLMGINDPCWSRHPDQIPLTADEQRKADRLADEGTGTMRQVAEALAVNAGRILHEQQQSEVAEAARNAQLAEAAESERRAAQAERLRAEQAAKLREATRVAEAMGGEGPEFGGQEPQVVTPGKPRAVKKQAITRRAPDFPVEAHPSRKCGTCGGQLTRKAHSTGRWAGSCLGCREGVKAA